MLLEHLKSNLGSILRLTVLSSLVALLIEGYKISKSIEDAGMIFLRPKNGNVCLNSYPIHFDLDGIAEGVLETYNFHGSNSIDMSAFYETIFKDSAWTYNKHATYVCFYNHKKNFAMVNLKGTETLETIMTREEFFKWWSNFKEFRKENP